MRSLQAVVSILLFRALLPQHGASGQVIEGRVIDLDAIPISGASVAFRLESRELIARVASDDEGFFRVGAIDPGEYFVLVERLGYQTTTTPLSLREGDSISVELRMAVEAIPLDPIVVTASPRSPWEYTEPPALWEFWERKDFMGRLGLGKFHTYRDLKPLQGSQVAQAIVQLNPFLILRPNEERVNSFHISGRSGCSPLIFLDGHRLRGPGGLQEEMGRGTRMLTGSPAGPLIDDYISLPQIAAVEVYRGASDVPGEFRQPGSNCGVVAVWSLRGTVR